MGMCFKKSGLNERANITEKLILSKFEGNYVWESVFKC
jgi:hypothetical protein